MALDARRITGLADGAGVSTWSDLSGNANDATQGTSGNRPAYTLNAQGGQPTVRFDGSNDYLSFATGIFTYTGDATVIALVKTSGGASEYGSVITENNNTVVQTSIGCQMTVFPNAGPELCTDVYAPGGMRYNSTCSTDAHVARWQWQNWSTHKSNGNTSLAIDGVANGGTAYGSNPLAFTSSNKNIGRFDATGSGGSHLAMDLSALYVWAVALAAPLRKRIEQHLAFAFKVAIS